VLDRVDRLAAELGVPLAIERHWGNESGSGHYCRVLGTIHDSSSLRVDIVGSLAIGTKADETDLFVLVNGVRVSPVDDPFAYLHRREGEGFCWDDLDEGYQVQTTLDGLLLRKS
jgi:hypothetical protein